jgi:hypothetical protein
MSDTLGTNLKADDIKVQKAARSAMMPSTVKIILEENDDIPPTGLFIGVNGRGYLIKPGEPVTIPASVVEVLDHAVMSSPQVDPQTRQVIGYRDRLRYSYRLVST